MQIVMKFSANWQDGWRRLALPVKMGTIWSQKPESLSSNVPGFQFHQCHLAINVERKRQRKLFFMSAFISSSYTGNINIIRKLISGKYCLFKYTTAEIFTYWIGLWPGIITLFVASHISVDVIWDFPWSIYIIQVHTTNGQWTKDWNCVILLWSAS